jgi:hypothetical protein
VRVRVKEKERERKERKRKRMNEWMRLYDWKGKRNDRLCL